ncbi:MAG: hypothetical protein QXQ90_06690 [Desulfurococcaceae archaeon]
MVLVVELARKLEVRSENMQCWSYDECLIKSHLLAERTLAIATIMVAILALVLLVLILVSSTERTSRS